MSDEKYGEGSTTLDMLYHNYPWLREQFEDLEKENAQIAEDYQDVGREMHVALNRHETMLMATAEALRAAAHTWWWDPQRGEEGAIRHYCWCANPCSSTDPRNWEHNMKCILASEQLQAVWRYLDEQRPKQHKD